MPELEPVRFLWQSNAPWAATGYGQQTRLVMQELIKRGHAGAVFAFYGLGGASITYDDYPVFPNALQAGWGESVVNEHIDHHKAEMLVTLSDIFVYNVRKMQSLRAPWVAWLPVDCDEIGWPTLQRLEHVAHAVAMSNHGAEQLRAVGVEPLDVIYHAVDTEVFRPLDRYEARRALGIDEDAFIVGTTMANHGERKLYPRQLEAVKMWMDQNPDRDIRIFMHTNPARSGEGWDMHQVIRKLGLEGKVYGSNEYYTTVQPVTPQTLAVIYNAMDVLINASAGEGFGIPIVEAQACGVPVITQDCTAMSELTHNGYAVKVADRYLAHHYGWQYLFDKEDFVYRLESVYRMTDRARREAGRNWVIEHCDPATIGAKWEQVLLKVRELSQEKHVVPITAPIHDDIAQARRVMDETAHHYGTYEERKPEYDILHRVMTRNGLQPEQYVLDLGAGYGDLGRFMLERGWRGVYVPVDMIIDGTDLNDYDPPAGFDYVIMSEVIEHLDDWQTVLDRVEKVAGCVVITTPNGDVVPDKQKHDDPGQMAHKHWITRTQLEERGYEVELASLSGVSGDTLVAWRRHDADDH